MRKKGAQPTNAQDDLRTAKERPKQNKTRKREKREAPKPVQVVDLGEQRPAATCPHCKLELPAPKRPKTLRARLFALMDRLEDQADKGDWQAARSVATLLRQLEIQRAKQRTAQRVTTAASVVVLDDLGHEASARSVR